MKYSNFDQVKQYVEKYFQYQFKDQFLIEQALTHKSFCVGENKNKAHNERLEFLGDAVLGLVVAENLMQQSPSDHEGTLSKKRASLVNQSILAEKAKKMNLNLFLILGPGEKEQKSHLKPRLLASAYEALIGAFYLDAEFSLVKKYLMAEFSTDIGDIKPNLEYEKDYKTRLQEITQKLKLGVPVYKLESTQGPSHKPEFEVSISIADFKSMHAKGYSKKIAEQLAAQKFIKELSRATKLNIHLNDETQRRNKNDNQN